MQVRIRLDTTRDINKFVQIVSQIDCPVNLTNGSSYIVSAKSLLGAMYSMEWDNIFCECEKDIYTKIAEFVVDETPADKQSF